MANPRCSLLDEVCHTPPVRTGQISPLLELRTTRNAGRSLYATQDIEAGTFLCRSSVPFARTVVDAYRQEVCETCFKHRRAGTGTGTDKGNWTVCQSNEHGRGVRWFCSLSCKDEWTSTLVGGDVGVMAVLACEELVRTAARRQRSVFDAKRKGDGLLEGPASWKEVEDAWENAASLMRYHQEESDTVVGFELLREDDDANVLRLLLDGIIGLYLEKRQQPGGETSCCSTLVDRDGVDRKRPSWNDVRSLVPSLHSYANPTGGKALLFSHIRMFHSLHTCLRPSTLVSLVTPVNILIILTRDCTNSFGIWKPDDSDIKNPHLQGDVEDDDNDENLLGYATYPKLSFFNHSCDPNVRKERKRGTTFEFTATRPITAGEEVCISYLSGRERATRTVRRKRLKAGWDFDCSCERCQAEG